MKFIILFICIPLAYSEKHWLNTTYTEINGKTIAGIPEFSAVTTLDDQQIDYYDSNKKKLIPKQDWMESVSEELWKNYTEIREKLQQIYKINSHVIMETFTQSHGVHTYQRMYGCDYDDKTGYSQVFDQYGYDGEDFISLDLKEDRYIASVPQAFPIVEKWNNDRTQLISLKQYYDQCVYWLRKFLKLRKADIERRAPEVSLLQKHPSSPVVCHATGFYPSGVSITWLRNGVNHYEDVEHGDLLPNEDGTFQKNQTLNVSPDEWEKNNYTCEVEHQGKTIQKNLIKDEIKSNYRPTNACLLITLGCVIGGVIVIVLVICTAFYNGSKKPEHKPVPSESEEYIVIDKGL